MILAEVFFPLFKGVRNLVRQHDEVSGIPGANIPPKVSIIIPAYNSARFLPETLDSVISQNYQAYELIIVDDGSTDNTKEILRPYTDKIRYVSQANAGSAAARNTGLELARGEFIVFLDADDLLLPGKLKEQAAFLEVRPPLGMVHSGWHEIDEAGNHIRTIEPWHEAPVLDLLTWFKAKPIRMGAMMYRRLWLESVGGLDATIRQSHDVDLMLRLALAGCTAEWLYKPTMCYRFYAESTIRRNARKQQGYVTRVITKFLDHPNLPAEIQQIADRTRYYNLRWLAWHLYESGYPEALVSPLEQGFYYAPRSQNRTAVEIAERFAKFLADNDLPISEIEQIMPLIQKAGRLSDNQWPQVERLVRWWLARWPLPATWPYQDLNKLWLLWANALRQEIELEVPAEKILSWWVDVWWWYLSGIKPPQPQPFAPFSDLPAKSMIKICQFCLVQDPGNISLEKIDRLWGDLLAAGVCDNRQKNEIASLYLTYLGQQLLGKQWQQSAHTLLQTLPLSFSAAGVSAWKRFGQATFSYYPIGLNDPPALLLGEVPTYPDESLRELVQAVRRAGWHISAACKRKVDLHPISIPESDWLPAQALQQLAKSRPSNHSGFLRSYRQQHRQMAHYRYLPLMGRPWQTIYLPSIADALAQPALFTLNYKIVVRGQGQDELPMIDDNALDILRCVHLFHCNSKSAQNWLSGLGIDPEKLVLIYPGVDCGYFEPNTAPPTADTWRLVMADQFDWRNGIEYGLLAFQKLLEQHEAAHLDIIGDGPDYDRVLYSVHDLDLETAVTIHRRASKESVKHLFQQADLFLTSQVQDGVPQPLLQAMACGLPVVAAAFPAVAEIIEDGVEGCVVPLRDPDRLTAVLGHLAAHPDQRRQLGRRARQKVEARFNQNQFQTAVSKLLQKIR